MADDSDSSYRDELWDGYLKNQGEFDRNVIFLSGGALGITFAFLDQLTKSGHAQCRALLALAWMSWGLSVTCSLASHYFGAQACREAIEKLDRGTAASEVARGFWTRAVEHANLFAGALFLLGLVLASVFILVNP